MRCFQNISAFSSDSTLTYSATVSGIKNNHITKTDVDIYVDVLGPRKYVVPGKNARKILDPMDTHSQLVSLCSTIKFHYSDVKLSADTLHANNVTFIASMSEYAHYGTTSAVDNMKCETLELELQNIVRFYAVRGFRVILLMVVVKFNNLKYLNKVGIPISTIGR